MEESREMIIDGGIKNKIYTIRGQQVMIDSDLAELYEVKVKALNQSVKRNIERFPREFMFQLTKKEFLEWEMQKEMTDDNSLRSQFVTLKNQKGAHRKYLPYAFTEQGVAMLAGILKSKIAIKISIKIIKNFVQMRKILNQNTELFNRLNRIELKQLEADKNFQKIFKALDQNKIKPKQGIFYDGQIFDAYVFIAKIIKSAKKEMILIDNYVDETVLELFSKRKKQVKVTIYTQRLTEILKQDLAKYNQQHQDRQIKIETFKKAHDRFLIIDNKVIYHIGASLKDLGKRWFGFSKLEIDTKSILDKLKNK